MNTDSRTYNTIKNAIIGVGTQGISTILNFAARLVFVRFLSVDYLGLNGLFTNILTVLSLAELGVGSAIVYNLYRPIAEGDEKKIAALVNLYRRAYMLIGIVIAAVGIALTPFLQYIIKNMPDIKYLKLIYLMFLFNTVLSYFFAYKRSIISADQREYILSEYRFCFNVIKIIVQIITLFVLRSFLAYLFIQILATFCENCAIAVKADQLYPFLSKYKKERISRHERKTIVENLKALVIYKLGSTALDGTDNIILSAFVGIEWVGKLSNYTLVMGAVSIVANQIITSLTASVGNYIAKEKKERHEDLLKVITWGSFLIYGFSFICLCVMTNPFIELCFGKEYLLSDITVFIISLNFYIFGMMNSVWTFRTTMGLFIYGKFRPLVSAVINIIISIILTKYMGVMGVLLGTTITRLVTNVIYDPYIVYRYGLKKSPIQYYLLWIQYLAIALADIGGILIIKNNLKIESAFGRFIVLAVLCTIISSCSFLLHFHRKSEFLYVKNNILIKFLGRKV